MFGLIIYYFYFVANLSAGRFFLVNHRDSAIQESSDSDEKDFDFNKAIDNSLADYSEYNDAFEKRIFQTRKYQKFQNFIKNNPELWRDADEITKRNLIDFLQFQYRRNSMLED